MGAINRVNGTPDDLPPRSGWTTTWAAAPQLTEPDNLPPAPFTRAGLALTDCTLRQTVHLSIGGDQLRLRFSNAFGRVPLRIGSVSLALPVEGAAGASAIRPATCRQVLFGGQSSVTVPPGSLAVSDPVRLDVTPRSNLAVTAYLPDGIPVDGLTSHPGSRTTSHLMAGDVVADPDPGPTVQVEHWYLLSAVEVVTGSGAFAVVMLGDSLTDGRGSTTNGNDRWPDLFTARLHDTDGTAGAGLDPEAAVVNQAAGGNRVLADGIGPSALSRLDRDVLALSGVRHLVV
ncbi:MAG: hypothetical protein QG622_2718, partial [Actinomycetota bacterium]|nr:hypothetical protein [Actinomycetota bacterium]